MGTGRGALPTALGTPHGRARWARLSGVPTSRTWPLAPMRNVYVISAAYYPAQIAEPTPEHRKAIRGAARVMVGAGKVVPLEFLHATGMLAGARGYPRCSDAAISAAGVLAEISGGAWGPPCLSPHVQRRIDGLRAWATPRGDGHPEWPEWARGDQCYKDRIGSLLAKWAAGDLSRKELARSGGDIYAALWGAGLGGGGGAQDTITAMVARAKARRWFPASGDEWGFARYVTGFNTVFHVSRILCGGTAPGVTLRSRDIRVRFPRKCDACDSPHVAWSWITGSPGHPGMAWCEECMASDISRHGLGSSATPTPGTAIWARPFGQPRRPLRAWRMEPGGPWAASTVRVLCAAGASTGPSIWPFGARRSPLRG